MSEIITTNTQLPAKPEELARFILFGNDRLNHVKAELSAMKRAAENAELANSVYEQKLQETQDLADVLLLAQTALGECTKRIPKATKYNNPSGLKGTQFIPGCNLGSDLSENASENKSVDKPESNSVNKETNKTITKTEQIKSLGLNARQVSEMERMADHPDIVKQVQAEARERGELATRKEVINRIRATENEASREGRRQENAEKIKKLATPLEAQGLFQTIVIDPPWDWGDEGDVDQFGRAKPDYHTMPIEEIKALPVNEIADKDCHLYLWVTNRSLPKAFSLVDAWGFRYITCLTWVKPSFGMGNYFRGSTEQVLFAVKGSQPLKRKDVGTHFEAPRGSTHSAKPDEFYKLVESCSYGPYIDIFGRKDREGWSVWGENG